MSVFDGAVRLFAITLAVTPMWIYVFADVPFEFTAMMAMAVIGALVVITSDTPDA